MKRIETGYDSVRIVRGHDFKRHRTTMLITIENSSNDIFEDLNELEDAIISGKIIYAKRYEPDEDNIINLEDYR